MHKCTGANMHVNCGYDRSAEMYTHVQYVSRWGCVHTCRCGYVWCGIADLWLMLNMKCVLIFDDHGADDSNDDTHTDKNTQMDTRG